LTGEAKPIATCTNSKSGGSKRGRDCAGTDSVYRRHTLPPRTADCSLGRADVATILHGKQAVAGFVDRAADIAAVADTQATDRKFGRDAAGANAVHRRDAL